MLSTGANIELVFIAEDQGFDSGELCCASSAHIHNFTVARLNLHWTALVPDRECWCAIYVTPGDAYVDIGNVDYVRAVLRSKRDRLAVEDARGTCPAQVVHRFSFRNAAHGAGANASW